MASKKAPERKHYGRRGDGKTQTTLSLSEEVLEKARKAAETDGRSLSNFIEQLLKKSLLLMFILFLLWHFLPASRPAIREAGRLITAAAKSAAAYVAKL